MEPGKTLLAQALGEIAAHAAWRSLFDERVTRRAEG
jgi:hypothetical protein